MSSATISSFESPVYLILNSQDSIVLWKKLIFSYDIFFFILDNVPDVFSLNNFIKLNEILKTYPLASFGKLYLSHYFSEAKISLNHRVSDKKIILI